MPGKVWCQESGEEREVQSTAHEAAGLMRSQQPTRDGSLKAKEGAQRDRLCCKELVASKWELDLLALAFSEAVSILVKCNC